MHAHCMVRYLEAVEVLAELDRVAHEAQTHRRQLFRVAHVEPERGANQRVATDKALRKEREADSEGERRKGTQSSENKCEGMTNSASAKREEQNPNGRGRKHAA